MKAANQQPPVEQQPLRHYRPAARRIWPILVIVPTVLAFFYKLAFTNLILARGDTFLYFYPYWQAAADALRAGQVPLWNPHLFMGAPFLANSQAGVLYPLNWPVWLLLPTPYAASATIVLHLIIAATGTYLAGHRALRLGRPAAFLAAVLFSLGGYLTAQVEHVNQLQGLAWLPWYLVVLADWPARPPFRVGRLVRTAAGLAALFALQLLAGHTQTAFISGVGIVIWMAVSWLWLRKPTSPTGPTSQMNRPVLSSHLILYLAPLVLGGLLALVLAAGQLLPTLELTGYSSRQGGLPINEALSFSLHPLLLGRALLPAFGQSLFSEYVAFLPLTALVLAVIGGWQSLKRPYLRPVVVLAVIGLFLALGQFNPFNYLLVRLPGFSLFRVPARWLALYALAMALLAGQGFQTLSQQTFHLAKGQGSRENLVQPVRLAVAGLLVLMAWSIVAVWLAGYVQVGPESPAELPGYWTWSGWLIELGLLWLILGPGQQLTAKLPGWVPGLLISAVLVLALFLASRSLPYNNPTTPEAYFDLRPPLARLKSASDCHHPLADCIEPPSRFLSLSNIFFDPGDQAEIDTIYADQLSPQARYDYTIAVKQKEIVAPNLPLTYGLAAVDGFDGGILPIRDYTLLTRLILPVGKETTDGRLREQLEAVPEARWLDLFNSEYVITDKVGDVWRPVGPPEADYTASFDLQHHHMLAAGQLTAVGYVPAFPSTALYLLTGASPGQVLVESENEQIWELTPELYAGPEAAEQPLNMYRVAWHDGRAQAVTAVTLQAAPDAPWEIYGLTLVNEDDGTFQSLVPGAYRLIHSGDVKIYQNLDVLPRAFLVDEWLVRPSVEASVAAMADPVFDPARQAVIVADGPERRFGTGQTMEPTAVTFLAYEPELVTLIVTNRGPDSRLLLLSDAYYPGWQATVDGQPATLYQADGLFRGVMVPAGEHQIIFTYRATSYQLGRWLSLAGLVLVVVLLAMAVIERRRTGR